MNQLDDVEKIARALTGKLIPGGCDYCDADQKMWRDLACPGLVHVEILHEPNCPFLKELKP